MTSAARPSLDLVRAATDTLVLRVLLAERRLTRAEIAARTGVSKPTASESVRRLVDAGLLRDTGERTTGRGRVGTYYGLSPDVGAALVVSIAPEGIVVESVDVHGDRLRRSSRASRRPAAPAEVARAVRDVAAEVLAAGPGARLAVVSAADPVDRTSGRLVHLPDAPFLLGDLDAVEVLAPLVPGPVHVDNDVNWAARAERDAAEDALDDFVYLHLGEGLGCAVVSDGEVRRGATGLAGEIAHVLTSGPTGRARAFTDVFADLDLRRHGSTAIDVPALLQQVTQDDQHGAHVREALAAGVSGVVTAVVALADPDVVVLGGAWGAHDAMTEAIRTACASGPRPVRVRAGTVREPAVAGARQAAVARLQHLLVSSATRPTTPSAAAHTRS